MRCPCLDIVNLRRLNNRILLTLVFLLDISLTVLLVLYLFLLPFSLFAVFVKLQNIPQKFLLGVILLLLRFQVFLSIKGQFDYSFLNACHYEINTWCKF